MGALARALGRPPRPADRGRADGAGARGRAGPGDDLPPARGRRRGRAGAARRAARPLPPRPARAAAARLRRLRRLRARRRGPGAQGLGVGLELPQGGREPEHQLAFGGVLGFDELLASRRARARTGSRRSRRASGACRGGCGAGCCPSRSWRRDEHGVRRQRPAAGRRDRARGERGHRQDVHDRRAGGALRGRGHAAGRAAARDLHADGDRRAARPRARAAGDAEQGLARALAGAPPHRDEVVRLLARARPRRSSCAAAGSRTRWPTSTRRRSPPPTASARRCSAGSAWPATSSPT